MKRKIIIALLMLLLFSASGAVLATYFITHTTMALSGLIKLHQIEDLRQHLIISIQAVQTDLYTVKTPFGNDVDAIADNVSQLENSARNCSGCHHKPAVAEELQEVEALVGAYQDALSYYITSSANLQRIERLKFDAAAIGNDLLNKTEEMSFRAAKKLETATTSALVKIEQARSVLFLTIGITFIFGMGIAIYLIRAVTGPIGELVTATRAIATGDLDHTVMTNDKTEFGELAGHFNAMSRTLRKNYEDLVNEVIERHQIEDALRESEERYALAARGANDGLWDLDLRSDKIYYSSRWKSMLGYNKEEISNSLEEWLGRVYEPDRAKVEANLAEHIEGSLSHLECEYRIRHKDNKILWVLVRGLAVRDAEGRAYRLAGSHSDITARKKVEEQMVHDAFHDHLTGLPNRALFMDRLQHVIESSRRRDSHDYAVLFMDLARFKIINDSLGHEVGDKLLIELGKRLKVCLRPGDTVARLGGDEFAILLDQIADKTDIEEVVRRIEKEVVAPFHIRGHKLFTSQSIGIAAKLQRYATPDDILRDADIAMYQAKSFGGARHVFFDTVMHSTIIARNELEGELRSAVDRHEDFVLYYQPIMNLKDRSIRGFEALIRWRHLTKGIIQPNDFIPLAEETGLIIPLSKWVLRQACRQLRVWHDMYPSRTPLKISINISSKMLLEEDLVDIIANCLREEGVKGECLAIEITENLILESSDAIRETLQALQRMGLSIHIDDFGTGYSSLSYLHNFPVNVLKIDRSFISKISANGDDLEIVRTIIAMAHNLKLDVIAEGVEQEHQLSAIHGLDCAYGQGFFFSKAISAEAIPFWIESHNILAGEHGPSVKLAAE
jgi:diguanylate cyclase (GGDEF)-like protein/PAS domain S-box-containing protein